MSTDRPTNPTQLGRPKITFGHALANRLVQVPGGSVGKLVYAGRRGGRCTVVVGGRHYRYRPDELTLVEGPTA